VRLLVSTPDHILSFMSDQRTDEVSKRHTASMHQSTISFLQPTMSPLTVTVDNVRVTHTRKDLLLLRVDQNPEVMMHLGVQRDNCPKVASTVTTKISLEHLPYSIRV